VRGAFLDDVASTIVGQGAPLTPALSRREREFISGLGPQVDAAI
jgi:hypothetical protein